MSVASTLNCPPITLGTPKSVITRVKITKVALISPYLAPGRVTVKKVRSLLVLSAAAASYRRASEIDSAVTRIISAWGKVQKAEPMMTPIGP